MRGAVRGTVSHAKLQYSVHAAWFLWLFPVDFDYSFSPCHISFSSVYSSEMHFSFSLFPDWLTQTWASLHAVCAQNIGSYSFILRYSNSPVYHLLSVCPSIPPALIYLFIYFIDSPSYFSISDLNDLPLRPTCLLPHLSALIWRPAHTHVNQPAEVMKREDTVVGCILNALATLHLWQRWLRNKTRVTEQLE